MNYKLIIFILIAFSNSLFAQITEIGQASFYADKFDGRVTASGDIFDQNKMTAAHRTLPFGSKVRVTNIQNNKNVIVTINDRGPFVNDRVIDLSKAAAKKLEFIGKGVTKVKIEVLAIPNDKQSEVKAYTPPPTLAVAKPEEQKPANASSANISSQAIEYYKVESALITPQGFGIQVASYKEAANLMKRCDELKQSTGKDIIIQVANNDGDKVYRIMLGTFDTKEKAVEFNEKISNQFRGSFVVAFN